MFVEGARLAKATSVPQHDQPHRAGMLRMDRGFVPRGIGRQGDTWTKPKRLSGSGCRNSLA